MALLLKTIATLIDSRDYGLLLCRTLLKPGQLKLISRGISAPRNKEHIISPCLRILTEIVSFDGGVMAKSLYSKREWSFESKIMARNLGLSKGEEDRRRPSVRSNAIRYLLANFKYQDEGAKIDILRHGHITKALFDHLKEDPVEVLQDVFKVVETHVLRDESIPRTTRSHTMGERSLSGVLAALRAQANAEAAVDDMQVDGETPPAVKGKTVTFNFLKLVCTTPSLGVLRVSGWYPPGSEKHTRDETEEPETDVALDLGLDSVDWYDRYHGEVPVRNTILSGFLQSLRPYASEEERDLLLATFASGPELVADYFFTKGDKFPFDPKLTNTWIGYASFLFSAVETSFPHYFGSHGNFAGCPPPVSIAIENILPLPLSQKVLTRCLNQSSDLITLFAVRILVVAFQKLQKVLKAFATAASEGNALWREGANKLISEFCQRCPPMKDVVATFRKTAEENILQKEAVSRLLQLYYEVTPQYAMEEKFDVSASLTTALSRIETMESSHEQYSFRLLELQHLLVVAQCSVGMRWWHKQGSLKFSPFITLLRLCAQMPKDQAIIDGFITLIESVIFEHDILQRKTQASSAKALIASLTLTDSWIPSDATYTFLDECLGRLVRKPIKYLDDLEALSRDKEQDESASLLLMVCLEQAPFTSNLSSKDQQDVMTWLSLLIRFLGLIGESDSILDYVQSQTRASKTSTSEADLREVLDSLAASSGTIAQNLPAKQDDRNQDTNTTPSIMFTQPPAEKQNHPELTRWQNRDLDDSLENGDINALLLCLSHSEASIRIQAVASLRKLLPKIQESTYAEKDQLYILIGEVLETATSPLLPQPLAQLPLPYLATAFATAALQVLQEPSHFMYPKLNKYLNRGPAWSVQKLPAYWLDRTLLSLPDEDDKYWAEVEWVLTFLVDGLRSVQDALLLISRGSLEKLLGISASPSAPRGVREAIAKLVFRIVKVGAGMSAVTRAAVFAWLDARDGLKDMDAASLKMLRQTVLDGIDEDRMVAWSKGGWNSSKIGGIKA